MTPTPLALVTGASGGIGAEFARQLAPTHDLLLVARSVPRLERVRDTLTGHGNEVDVLSADLSTAAGVESVIERGRAAGRPLDLLVNNAGSGVHGPFAGGEEADAVGQVALDVTAVVALTRAFLPAMIEAGTGGVVNVGSTAGFQPTPGLAVYAACKAFVLSFTEAVAVEVRGTGVRVSVIAPGTVDTGFFDAAGATFEAGGMLTPAAVVTSALRGHAQGRTVVVPGLRNKAGTLGPRILPRSIMARTAAWVARAR